MLTPMPLPTALSITESRNTAAHTTRCNCTEAIVAASSTCKHVKSRILLLETLLGMLSTVKSAQICSTKPIMQVSLPHAVTYNDVHGDF